MRTSFLKKHFETKPQDPPEPKVLQYKIKLLFTEFEYALKQAIYRYAKMRTSAGENIEAYALESPEVDDLNMDVEDALNNAKAQLKPWVIDICETTTADTDSDESATGDTDDTTSDDTTEAAETSEEIVVSNEILDHEDEYIVTMQYENGWTGNPKRVMSTISSYIKNYTISEWFRKEGIDAQAERFEQLANKYLNMANSEVNSYDLEPQIMERI